MKMMNRLLINGVYRPLTVLVAIVAFPWLLVKRGWGECRRRFMPDIPILEGSVWIHAASLGEVNALKPVLTQLLVRFPHLRFALTVMTPTGFQAAEAITGDFMHLLYPFDFGPIVKRLFRRLRPRVILIVETELWPNMLFEAARRNIPVVMINARLSARSVRRYTIAQNFWKPLFSAIKVVLAQSDSDRDRYLWLGVAPAVTSGNIKYGLSLPQFDGHAVRKELRFSPDDFVIVAGSSRPGEEALLALAWQTWKQRIPGVKMIVAPRHLNRLEEVRSCFAGEDSALLSDNRPAEILIIDAMGLLARAYSIADLAIVGGSFTDFGGHNPLEPAYYGVPVLMGPYHSSCRDLVKQLSAAGGLRVIDGTDLGETVSTLANDKPTLREMGQAGKDTVSRNQNSVTDTLSALEPFLR